MQNSIKKDDKFLKLNTRELIERNSNRSVVTTEGIEIINDLTSIHSDKALSANMGRLLNEKIMNLEAINVVKEW